MVIDGTDEDELPSLTWLELLTVLSGRAVVLVMVLRGVGVAEAELALGLVTVELLLVTVNLPPVVEVLLEMTAWVVLGAPVVALKTITLETWVAVTTFPVFFFV